jgi:hypothetical protein
VPPGQILLKKNAPGKAEGGDMLQKTVVYFVE